MRNIGVQIIDENGVKAYFSPIFADKDKPQKRETPSGDRRFFNKGSHYFLESDECECFEQTKREYEYVGRVNNVNGVNLDSIIVKKISDDNTTYYTLTKNDCKEIGIPFENGLILMPKSLNWKKGEEEVVENKANKNMIFDCNDLMTYPTDASTNTIKFMLVDISCFRKLSNDAVQTPMGVVMKAQELLDSLHVTLKRNIQTLEGVLCEGTKIVWRVMTEAIDRSSQFITPNNHIYIELMFAHPTTSNGVIPNEFEGLKITDIVDITWCPSEESVYRTLSFCGQSSRMTANADADYRLPRFRMVEF